MAAFRPVQHRSQPVLWWELINQAEALRARTGRGLAPVWHWIHRGDYPRARAALDQELAMEQAVRHG